MATDVAVVQVTSTGVAVSRGVSHVAPPESPAVPMLLPAGAPVATSEGRPSAAQPANARMKMDLAGWCTLQLYA